MRLRARRHGSARKRYVVIVAVVAAIASACRGRASEPARPAIVFATGQGQPVRAFVELARTADERQQGLMHRRELAPDAGMLFLFENEQILHFWMKDTPLPLDLIFLDRDLVVVGVMADAEPMTTIPRTIGKPAQYVLEVNAGWARRHAIAEGVRAQFESVAIERDELRR
jgi:uncharacterized membrane protein (UPF0127 family)